MSAVDVAQVVTIVVCGLGLIAIIYVMAGGWKLWGPERGVPFCGHPFEQTWRCDPPLTEWRCPKCHTEFVPHGGKWLPRRYVERITQ